MACAVVNLDGTITAIIVAEPTDTPYPGTSLVLIPDEYTRKINLNWTYIDGLFIDPLPSPKKVEV